MEEKYNVGSIRDGAEQVDAKWQVVEVCRTIRRLMKQLKTVEANTLDISEHQFIDT